MGSSSDSSVLAVEHSGASAWPARHSSAEETADASRPRRCGTERRERATGARAGIAERASRVDSSLRRAHGMLREPRRRIEGEPLRSGPLPRAGSRASSLCVPLLAKHELVALLYLEHGLAAHVFTPERVERCCGCWRSRLPFHSRTHGSSANCVATNQYLAEAQKLSQIGILRLVHRGQETSFGPMKHAESTVSRPI